MTVVAGPPMAGKSEFVLDLLCRLGRLHKFKAGISACELSVSPPSSAQRMLHV